MSCRWYIILYTTRMKKKPSAKPRDQIAFLDELTGFWPVAKGSLAEVRKPCGRKTCVPCQEGRKHPAFIFTFRRSGKTLCRHVPCDLVPRLRQAIANGRRMEEALVRAGEGLILQHRQDKEDRTRGA
jgi:hypothetical protein